MSSTQTDPITRPHARFIRIIPPKVTKKSIDAFRQAISDRDLWIDFIYHPDIVPIMQAIVNTSNEGKSVVTQFLKMRGALPTIVALARKRRTNGISDPEQGGETELLNLIGSLPASDRQAIRAAQGPSIEPASTVEHRGHIAPHQWKQIMEMPSQSGRHQTIRLG